MRDKIGNCYEFSKRRVFTKVNRHTKIIVRVYFVHDPNKSEAEDILQETNLILCQKAGEYDPSKHFQGWAFKIARFQMMKYMTNSKRNKIQFSTELLEEVASKNLILEKYNARKPCQFAMAYCQNPCNPLLI